MIDPNLLKNANQQATNKYTARGVDDLALDYTAVPSGVQAELEKVVFKINEILASERARFARELTP